jgi:hypothetical protein
VRLAASGAGVTRDAPYKRAKVSPTFAATWTRAREDAVDVLEAEARRRALNQSDSLLMFLLRAERPDKYRDRVRVAVDTEQMIERECERMAADFGVDPKELIAETKQMMARYPRPARTP